MADVTATTFPSCATHTHPSSGYPGGLRSVRYDELLDKNPEKAIEKAVKGMLPKNSLGRQMLSKLKVYRGDQHPHAAQQPVPFEITQVAQ
jgi:large subunit ribosomal protein L13